MRLQADDTIQLPYLVQDQRYSVDRDHFYEYSLECEFETVAEYKSVFMGIVMRAVILLSPDNNVSGFAVL